MENLVRDIVLIVAAVLFSAWRWNIVKDPASRKYILLFGIGVLIAGAAHIVAKLFDIPELSIVVLLGLISLCYFAIKVTLSERRARKKSIDDR